MPDRWGYQFSGNGEDRDKKIVEAEEFRLVDRDGKQRGSLTARENGAAMLMLGDSQQNVRLGITVLPDGTPSIDLFNERTEARVSLTAHPEGQTHIMLADDDGNVRLILQIGSDNTVQLTLNDTTDTARVILAATKGGSANVVFSEQSGKARAGMGANPGGEGTLGVWDSNGQVIHKVP